MGRSRDLRRFGLVVDGPDVVLLQFLQQNNTWQSTAEKNSTEILTSGSRPWLFLIDILEVLLGLSELSHGRLEKKPGSFPHRSCAC